MTKVLQLYWDRGLTYSNRVGTSLAYGLLTVATKLTVQLVSCRLVYPNLQRT
jgi:hypothetical protein